MQILNDTSLKLHSTMRLGGQASFYCEISNLEELYEAVSVAGKKNIGFRVIGEGSNIIWKDEGYKGLLIKNNIKGIKKLEEDNDSAVYLVGAGEMLDSFVDYSVKQNLSGIECLSLIPGTIGATPVQNVGAYGQEISDTLISVSLYDIVSKKTLVLKNKDCGFGYRTSIFKTSAKDRYIITSITLKLSKNNLQPPFYQSLQAYLDSNGISNYSPESIRKAVIEIRSSKLPDWHKIANSGSFFSNPIVDKKHFNNLKSQYPDIVGWPYENKIKIPAAWLLEKAGFKEFHDTETGIGTWGKQPLVLINESAKSTQSLLKTRQKMIDKVKLLFEIVLEQEPELLP